MRKPHRLTGGGSQYPRKKLLAILLALTIFSLFIILQPAIAPNRPLLSSDHLTTASFAGELRHPKFAYLISATRTEGLRVKRLLKAVYHPWNYYLLHIDRAVSLQERADLAEYVGSEPTFLRFGNVRVVGDADRVTLKGPTVLSSTLHAAAILLRWAGDWSWFINLDAADYPLMPQDDLLHIFSYLPRDLNFIEHTSNIGWKEHHRARPIIVDPGLYGSDKADVFWVKDKRSMPASFKLFVVRMCTCKFSQVWHKCENLVLRRYVRPHMINRNLAPDSFWERIAKARSWRPGANLAPNSFLESNEIQKLAPRCQSGAKAQNIMITIIFFRFLKQHGRWIDLKV